VKKLTNIVFTRNRPLQFEGYLRSFYGFLPREITQTIVIYKKDLFDEQYQGIFRQYPDMKIITETDFHKEFCEVVNSVDTPFINFGTDDVVYYDGVDLDVIERAFETYADDIFGFSLRISPETLLQQDNYQSCGDIYSVNWKQAHSANAKYPFELNSTIYKTSLIKTILSSVSRKHPLLAKFLKKDSFTTILLGKLISTKHLLIAIHSFKNPNDLESNCHRYCKRCKNKLPENLYFQKLCASAIQINTVNPAVKNQIIPQQGLDIYSLNKKFSQGYRLDVDYLIKNKPRQTHADKNDILGFMFRLLTRN